LIGDWAGSPAAAGEASAEASAEGSAEAASEGSAEAATEGAAEAATEGAAEAAAEAATEAAGGVEAAGVVAPPHAARIGTISAMMSVHAKVVARREERYMLAVSLGKHTQ
jgi:flagellar biosynthesis/type III secretory pathway protein FliH